MKAQRRPRPSGLLRISYFDSSWFKFSFYVFLAFSDFSSENSVVAG
jgi:hypothetical protein